MVRKQQEEIVLVSEPKYSVAEKIEAMLVYLKAIGLRVTISNQENHEKTDSVSIEVTFWSSTDMDLGHTHVLIGSKPQRCNTLPHTSIGGGTGVAIGPVVSEYIRGINDKLRVQFREEALEDELRLKIECRKYAEKKGVSLYQVYAFCRAEGWLPSVLLANLSDPDMRSWNLQTLKKIRTYSAEVC